MFSNLQKQRVLVIVPGAAPEKRVISLASDICEARLVGSHQAAQDEAYDFEFGKTVVFQPKYTMRPVHESDLRKFPGEVYFLHEAPINVKDWPLAGSMKGSFSWENVKLLLNGAMHEEKEMQKPARENGVQIDERVTPIEANNRKAKKEGRKETVELSPELEDELLDGLFKAYREGKLATPVLENFIKKHSELGVSVAWLRLRANKLVEKAMAEAGAGLTDELKQELVETVMQEGIPEWREWERTELARNFLKAHPELRLRSVNAVELAKQFNKEQLERAKQAELEEEPVS